MMTVLIYLLLIARTMSININDNHIKNIAQQLISSDSLNHRQQVMRDLFDSTITSHERAHELKPHHPQMISDIMQGMLLIHPSQQPSASDNN